MDGKGISPVISTVLLLMITVVVVAGTYSWFSGTMNTLAGRSGNTINTEVRRTEFDIEILDYGLQCNGTYAGIAKSAADGQGVANITLTVMGRSLGMPKKELETVTIKAIAIDGKVVNDGDYWEGRDTTIASGELSNIKINNSIMPNPNSFLGNATFNNYIGDLKINESDADETADNPMHWEDVEILFSTDAGTSIKRTLRMDANKKCL